MGSLQRQRGLAVGRQDDVRGERNQFRCISAAVGLVGAPTLETIGVDVSPHLFRTAAASTAAAYGGSTPHLASAVLNHTDPRVTEEHYNRATSIGAGRTYAEIVSGFRHD